MSNKNNPPELNISTETAFGLIELLHETVGLDSGLTLEESDGGDEASIESPADGESDGRSEAIATLVRDLNQDEEIDLVALALVGNDEFALEEWSDARIEARDRITTGGNSFTLRFVTEDEATVEFLEAGLNAFGFRFAEWDAEEVTAVTNDGADGGEPGDVADDALNQTPGQVHIAR